MIPAAQEATGGAYLLQLVSFGLSVDLWKLDIVSSRGGEAASRCGSSCNWVMPIAAHALNVSSTPTGLPDEGTVGGRAYAIFTRFSETEVAVDTPMDDGVWSGRGSSFVGGVVA